MSLRQGRPNNKSLADFSFILWLSCGLAFECLILEGDHCLCGGYDGE